LFGELFGQVAWRHPDGAWTWEETGALETILAAIDSVDGTRWAVAEGSALLKREAGGRWSRISVPLEDARPCLLYGDGDGSLLTVWTQPNAITVLRYRPSSENPWTTEHIVEAPKSLLGLLGSFDRCNAYVTSRGLLLVEKVPAFSQKYRIELLDSASARWSSYKFSNVSPLVVTPDGALLVLGGWAANPKYQLSRDLGKTWEDRANPAVLGMPLFKSASEGYLLRREADVPNVPASTTLWRTLDESKSWQSVTTFTNPPFDAVRMFDDTALFVTRYGLLYSSGDLGRRIRLERDSSAKLW
jgi:hypothetical protein